MWESLGLFLVVAVVVFTICALRPDPGEDPEAARAATAWIDAVLAGDLELARSLSTNGLMSGPPNPALPPLPENWSTTDRVSSVTWDGEKFVAQMEGTFWNGQTTQVDSFEVWIDMGYEGRWVVTGFTWGA